MLTRREILQAAAAYASFFTPQALWPLASLAREPAARAPFTTRAIEDLQTIAIPSELLRDCAFNLEAFLQQELLTSRRREEEALFRLGAPRFGDQMAVALLRSGVV